MQSAARVALSFIITSTLVTANHSGTKLRRDGVLNLYPFPRVGRASNTWELPINELYLEYKPLQKRQLYAFPRVGRVEAHVPRELQLQEFEDMILAGRGRMAKRTSESDSKGMWFGPRLGRSFDPDAKTERESPDNNGNDVPRDEELEQTDRKKRNTNH